MLGKILLAMGVALVLLVVLIVGLSMAGGSPTYHAGNPVPLPDGSTYGLICPKKSMTATPTSATYTVSSDGTQYNVKTNLQATLATICGNCDYVVDSKELLGSTTAVPGSLVFSYTCA